MKYLVIPKAYRTFLTYNTPRASQLNSLPDQVFAFYAHFRREKALDFPSDWETEEFWS